MAVHPRVCGEQAVDQYGNNAIHRFIPACAGNSIAVHCQARFTAVHPRVCGEQPIIVPKAYLAIGSSPRVRGTEVLRDPPVTAGRFIPACAGNSALTPADLLCQSVHPRVCGEQTFQFFTSQTAPGSSPRVRGTVVECQEGPDTRRFIPACAGNRAKGLPQHIGEVVHPRVCGEQSPPV